MRYHKFLGFFKIVTTHIDTERPIFTLPTSTSESELKNILILFLLFISLFLVGQHRYELSLTMNLNIGEEHSNPNSTDYQMV